MGGKLTEIAIAEQEGLTGFKTVISSDHAYIHDGIAFTGIINTGSISGAYNIAFTTPSIASGKFIHWRPIGITTSADYVSVVMTQDETFSNGTGVTPVNRNQAFAAVHPIEAASQIIDMVKGATCTPSGIELVNTGIGTSGNPAARAGGGAGADEELVLIPDTGYCITLTPDSATIVTLALFWYEENRGFDDDYR